MLLHGSLDQRFAIVVLLLACVGLISMVWESGWRGALRELFAPPRTKPHPLMRRWAWLMLLGTGVFLVPLFLIGFLLSPAPSPQPGVLAPGAGPLFMVSLAIGCGLFWVVMILGYPVVGYLADHIDVRRYSHIVECHPLAAMLLWYRGIGPRPLPSSYRRRCERWFCLFR
jgi:hypothetical protein